MRKSFLIAALAVLTVIVVVTFSLIGNLNNKSQLPPPTQKPAEATTAYEYFWGDGCPHCENVNNFLGTWDGAGKIELKRMEVFKNQDNARQMIARSQNCNLPRSEQGAVPLLYTPDGKCITGDTPIIDYFKSLNL